MTYLTCQQRGDSWNARERTRGQRKVTTGADEEPAAGSLLPNPKPQPQYSGLTKEYRVFVQSKHILSGLPVPNADIGFQFLFRESTVHWLRNNEK
jgi:hypothetical protein